MDDPHAPLPRSLPTLHDVAKAASVSPMTVSRVINGGARVRKETRERVHAAIAALGYLPNSAARQLAGARLVRITIVCDNPSAGYLSEVLFGALDEEVSTDVQVRLERRRPNESDSDMGQRLSAGGTDGILLPPPLSDSSSIVAPVLAAGIPVALLATSVPAPGAISVAIDDQLAAEEMTCHLAAQGHRRIGFIAGDPRQTASAKRLAGYRAGLDRAGLALIPELIASGDFSYRSGLAAAERLLGMTQRPTAIFASNDDMAAAVVAVAHRRHIDVPSLLSVCGFDDTALAVTISPELTTVRQPAASMASIAVASLAEAVRGRRRGRSQAASHVIVPHEIVHRNSVSVPWT